MTTESYNFIDLAKNNPNNKVTLDYEKGVFSFLIADDFSVDVGNNWESPLDGFLEKKIGGFSDYINIFKSYSGTDLELKTYRETVKFYGGSKSLNLQFNGVLIANKPTDNLIDQIKPLFNLSNPDFDANSDFSVTIKTPLGYQAKNNTIGKIGVKIGRFFKSSRVYILESATPTFSTAKLPNGKPLYINLRISLIPYRMLSITEVNSFFTS